MSLLLEGGKALGKDSSQIPKEFVVSTIENGMKKIGLEDVAYKPVGNISAQISNDIDLSISVEDLANKWNLPKPFYSDEFWNAIKEKVSQIPGAKFQPGLNEFHVPFELVDAKGKKQPMYKDGKPIANTIGVAQVDFFVGSQNWMKDVLSGKPEGSNFKAAFRNVLLGSIISTVDRKNTKPIATEEFPQGEFEEHKYVLNFKSGVEKVVTRIANPDPLNKRQKNPKKISVKREHFLENQDEMAAWLFGPGYTWEKVNSFEKVMDAFLNNKYYNNKYAKYREDIIKKVKETLTPEQLEMLQSGEYQELFKESMLNEGRESIGRFSGKNEFSPVEFLTLLKKLREETGNTKKESFKIDLLSDPSVDMVEKMDASFIHFGINKDGKFFMESNYSGEVTADNAQQVFGFRKESIDSFTYLHDNKKFQSALQQIYKTYGPVRFDSEMFPVFTHQGSKSGDVVFASTRYKKDKFGKFGGSVIFKCSKWSEEKNDWVRPEPAVSSEIISNFKKLSSGFEQEWKIYSNDDDMRLPGVIPFELGDLAEYLKPEKFEEAINILKSRKQNSEKDKLIEKMNSVRTKLQNILNKYADAVSSKLGDKDSNVEGVVLRIKAKDGEVFEVKGTSQKFAENAKVVWEDRKNSENVKDEFLTSVKKVILSLPSTTDKNILTTLENSIKQNNATLQQAVASLVPNYEQALNNLEKNLNIAIGKAREEVKSITKSIKSKKSILDRDSERKSIDYVNNLTILLNDYEIIGTSRSSNDKKYLLVLQKYYGAKLEPLLNTSQEPEKKEMDTTKGTRVIVWNGRAQPWHKGHDAMIQLGKKKLSTLKAEKIVIMVVKGGKSSKDLAENPLNEKEQLNLINSLYGSDPQIEIVEQNPLNAFSVIDICSKKKFIIVGWLAGDDRIAGYQDIVKRFNIEKFMTDHDFLPLDLDKKTGQINLEFIETPRIFSGKKSRAMIKDPNVTFEQWLKEISPAKISSSAKKQYEIVYNIMKERMPGELQEIILSLVNESKYRLISKKTGNKIGYFRFNKKQQSEETQVRYFKKLKEMSAMGSGDVAGGMRTFKSHETEEET